MALPSPDKLRELARLFTENAPDPSGFESYSETKAKIIKYSKMGLIAGVQTGLQSGVTALSGAASTTVNVGVGSIALFPLGAALGPWLGALAIGMKANGIFALHDLRECARKSSGDNYRCSCGACAANLTYVIDRQEANTAIMAVGLFTGGLAIIGDRINSIRKSFQKNRPKEKICKSLISGARGGCHCAIASVMMISGKWKNDEKADAALAAEAIAIIWSSDGDVRLKSKW